MAVTDLAFEHVDELHAGMLEADVGLGVVLQGDQEGLDGDVAVEQVAQQLVDVAHLGAAPLDHRALSGPRHRAVLPFLRRREQRGEGDRERRRDGVQGGQGRRDLAVLDLRQHARGDAGGGRQVRDGQVVAAPQHADLGAEGALQAAGLRRRGVGSRPQVLDVATFSQCPRPTSSVDAGPLPCGAGSQWRAGAGKAGSAYPTGSAAA